MSHRLMTRKEVAVFAIVTVFVVSLGLLFFNNSNSITGLVVIDSENGTDDLTVLNGSGNSMAPDNTTITRNETQDNTTDIVTHPARGRVPTIALKNRANGSVGRFNVTNNTDGTFDVELSANGEIGVASVESAVVLHGVQSLEVNAKIDDYAGENPGIGVITTEVVAVSNVTMDNAIVTLVKNGNVNAVVKCNEFDLDTFNCKAWEKTDIPFVDHGDYIEFVVVSFSGYGGAEITVINVQSYPTVGGNWTVLFNTTGTANLTITAVNGTTWSDTTEDEDLKFLEVKCGNTVQNSKWIDDSMFIENYSCTEPSSEVSKVITGGKHNLMFSFGEDTAFAFNDAGHTTCNALDSGVHTLANDVTVAGSCFNITLSNTAFDCQGNKITYSDSVPGYGFNVSNATAGIVNVTIKNCKIIKGASDATDAYGIYFKKVNLSVIFNNSVTTSKDSDTGIYLLNSSNNNVTSNNITTAGVGANGISIDTLSNDNVIHNNNITTSGQGGTGLNFIDSTNNNVTNNDVATIGPSASAVSLVNSNDTNVSSNDLNTTNSLSYGVFLSGSGSYDLFNNTVITSGKGSYGIYIVTAGDNDVYSNTINTKGNDSHGIVLETDAYRNTFTLNKISTEANASHGIFIQDSSHNAFVDNALNATNGSSSDWRIIYVSESFPFNNSAHNITLLRNNVSISFESFNGTAIKAVVPSEAAATLGGFISLNQYLNVSNTTLGAWLNLNISYTDSEVADVLINESTLRLWRYNSTGRWNDTGFYKGQYGVDVDKNIVFANLTNFSIFGIFGFKDADGDGINDAADTIQGNVSDVKTSGVDNLNMTINGSAVSSTINDSQVVLFYDGTDLLMNFTHNFSKNGLNLSNISIVVMGSSIVVNISGQLAENETKALYLSDVGFTSLCVKNAQIASVSNISVDCAAANETSFDTCLGSSAGVTINNIVCADDGDAIVVSNLSASGVLGRIVGAQNNPTSSTAPAAAAAPAAAVAAAAAAPSAGAAALGALFSADSITLPSADDLPSEDAFVARPEITLDIAVPNPLSVPIRVSAPVSSGVTLAAPSENKVQNDVVSTASSFITGAVVIGREESVEQEDNNQIDEEESSSDQHAADSLDNSFVSLGFEVRAEKPETLPSAGRIVRSKIGGLKITSEQVHQENLQAEIVKVDEIEIPPGGKLDASVTIRLPMTGSDHVPLQLSPTINGEAIATININAPRVPPKATSLVSADGESLSAFAVITNDGDGKQVGGDADSFTAAVVDTILPSRVTSLFDDETTVEMSIQKKADSLYNPSLGVGGLFEALFHGPQTASTKLYGPYPIKQGERFLMGQRFDYDQKFADEYDVVFTFRRGGEVVARQVHDLNLKNVVYQDKGNSAGLLTGAAVVDIEGGWDVTEMLFILFVIVIFCILLVRKVYQGSGSYKEHLVPFIERTHHEGYGLDEIRTALVTKGWEENVVDQMLYTFKK